MDKQVLYPQRKQSLSFLVCIVLCLALSLTSIGLYIYFEGELSSLRQEVTSLEKLQDESRGLIELLLIKVSLEIMKLFLQALLQFKRHRDKSPAPVTNYILPLYQSIITCMYFQVMNETSPQKALQKGRGKRSTGCDLDLSNFGLGLVHSI